MTRCECCGKSFRQTGVRYTVVREDGSQMATICHTCRTWRPYGTEVKYIKLPAQKGQAG